MTQLATHAQIVKNSSTNSPDSAETAIEPKVDPLISVNRKIAQNDLAGAITALSEAERLYPEDENVKNMHQRIFDIVSGRKSVDTNSLTIQ